jgi:hypothetical protein
LHIAQALTGGLSNPPPAVNNDQLRHLRTVFRQFTRSEIRIMNKHRIYTMSFANVYPMYISKAEKKGRTQTEVDESFAG